MTSLSSNETERAVLGSILLDERLLAQAFALKPEDFSFDAHRRIYRRMCDLADTSRPIDTVTLTEELARHREVDAIGGVAYLTSLPDGLPRRPNIAHYVHIIREAAGKRYALAATEAALEQARDGASLAELEQRFADIPQRLAEYRRQDSGEILNRLPDPLELDCEEEPWLMPGLLLRGGITLMSGAPGDGKTWQALAIARAVGLGSELYGRACAQAQVVMLDRENPKSIMQARWKLMFQESVRGRIAIWAGWSGLGEVPIIGDPRLMELAEDGRLLIFDSLIRFHSADENASAEMAPVMGKLRSLANTGASILVLHHRGKNELNRYRGSSEIVAGVDIACSLLKDEAGLLTLDIFKPRGTVEFKLTIQADYQTGQFRATESVASADREARKMAIVEAILASPGITQSRLIETMNIGRTDGIRLLKLHEGKLWRSERGTRNSLRYYPI